MKVSLSDQENPTLLKPTSDFQSLMLKAAKSGEYGNMVAVLCVAEWSYLSWAQPFVKSVESLSFYFSEWISLHTGEYFESVVEHLRTQLDTSFDNADVTKKKQSKNTLCKLYC